jgi:formylglycine-generating enzyme required for sulfatase activity
MARLDLEEDTEDVSKALTAATHEEKEELFDWLLMDALLLDALGKRRAKAAPGAPLLFTRIVKLVGVAALLMIVVGVFWLWRQRPGDRERQPSATSTPTLRSIVEGYRQPELLSESTGTGSLMCRSPRRGESLKVCPSGAKLTMGGYCDLALDPGTEIILRGEPHREAVELIVGRVVSEVRPQEGEYAVYTAVGWVKVKGTRFTTTVEHPSESKAGGGTRPPGSAAVTVSVASGEVEYRLRKESGVLRAGETRLFAQAGPVEPAILPAPAAQGQAKPELPKTFSVPLGTGVKMDFVLIPAGTFTMGTDKGASFKRPAHEVTITKPFYMGACEVTQAQWKAVMVENPSSRRGDDLPVVQISWDDCQTFLFQLNDVFGGAFTFRLPTEAEWEYTCRAGTKTAFSFGDDEALLGEYAWYSANSERKIHPVGQKKPNPWGLYDMHGNVSELCSDWYGSYPASPAAGVFAPLPRGKCTDPTGPTTGTTRVHRGGSYAEKGWACLSEHRGWAYPVHRWGNLGLRVVCTEAEAH